MNRKKKNYFEIYIHVNLKINSRLKAFLSKKGEIKNVVGLDIMYDKQFNPLH